MSEAAVHKLFYAPCEEEGSVRPCPSKGVTAAGSMAQPGDPSCTRMALDP